LRLLLRARIAQKQQDGYQSDCTKRSHSDPPIGVWHLFYQF